MAVLLRAPDHEETVRGACAFGRGYVCTEGSHSTLSYSGVRFRTVSQRAQILEGVAEAIAVKGYSATTIADIARFGRASRTTVYAQFPDKDSALVALHQDFGARVVA